MMFPYLRGMVFCAHLANGGGWEAIDDAYQNPPLSTEQILHPAKFRKNPDLPTAVELGALTPGDGWKELGRNVLGELQTSVMLRKQKGAAAAAGWDGDRYAVFEGPNKKLGLVWFTTWDGEDDAREFAQSYVRYQTSRMGKDAFQPGRIPDSLWRCVDDVCRVVERRRSDVVGWVLTPSATPWPPTSRGRTTSPSTSTTAWSTSSACWAPSRRALLRSTSTTATWRRS